MSPSGKTLDPTPIVDLIVQAYTPFMSWTGVFKWFRNDGWSGTTSTVSAQLFNRLSNGERSYCRTEAVYPSKEAAVADLRRAAEAFVWECMGLDIPAPVVVEEAPAQSGV